MNSIVNKRQPIDPKITSSIKTYDYNLIKKANPNISIKDNIKKYSKGLVLSVLFPINPKLFKFNF